MNRNTGRNFSSSFRVMDVTFSPEELQVLKELRQSMDAPEPEKDNRVKKGSKGDFLPDPDFDYSNLSPDEFLEALRNKKPRENEDELQGRDLEKDKRMFDLLEELLNNPELDPTEEQIEEHKRRATRSLLEMDEDQLTNGQLPIISYDELNKKFYRKVYIEETQTKENTPEFRVRIGQEQLLRTTTNKVVTVPSKEIAAVAAGEWELQEEYVRPATLPFTELLCRIEDVKREIDFSVSYNMKKTIHGFFDGEFVCLRQGMGDEKFTNSIKEHWDPLVQWFNKEFNTELVVLGEDSSFADDPAQEDARIKFIERYTTSEGIRLFKKTESVKYLFDRMSPSGLVLLNAMVEVTGSVVIASALYAGRINARQAALATQLPVREQTNTFGLVMGEHDLQFAEQFCKLSALELLLEIHPLSRDVSDSYSKVL
ncbi:hypothetical protein NAEGRDRAFT_79592 [Naegleria gruberi]|uniref:Uncharacterized protein n=1 Tax=Naegleria gruberi TaxID=5762 RepID=D2VDZ9_NAEGR|nr:uncharacterized protein NAEGRDRAFT_79592 [Naegleria gruberi]EFC44987.1 hypothetical protein NAEGRDRAFT_79592 [Naegleria gruberi]|eukprot:XP_002677731.1 hypothetical protein NAEGRDRAFT_79592 [Naegleria gruberi strain NEG-M]